MATVGSWQGAVVQSSIPKSIRSEGPKSSPHSVRDGDGVGANEMEGGAVGVKVLQPVPRLRSRLVVTPQSTHVSVRWSQPQSPSQSRTQVYMLHSGVGNGVGSDVVSDAKGDHVVVEARPKVRGSGVVVVACAPPPPQPQHMLPIVKSASSRAGEHSSGWIK